MFQLRHTYVLAAFGLAVFLICTVPPVFAQDQYPNRDIKIIVTFPAGGGVDVTARYLAEYMRKSLGQSVIVDTL